jgi:DNA-binding NarL/FixJ family response regulator
VTTAAPVAAVKTAPPFHRIGERPDDIGFSLSRIVTLAEVSARDLAGADPQLRSRLACIADVARRVVASFHASRPPELAEHDLTPHELRLLKLLVEGCSYKSAAAELGITTKTVSFHLQKIYEKLQVHSKSQAVAKALRDRLVY